MNDEIVLYDYWRSSASYRLRIALNLKGLPFRRVPVDLTKGEHSAAPHLERNVQGFVPVLEIDGRMMSQSLATIEYLEETRPEFPLLPSISADRQKVRALAHIVAMDIHPVCNPSVAFFAAGWRPDETEARREWMQHFIARGFDAMERQVTEGAPYCFDGTPGIADICLVPQIYNARRWGLDMAAYPKLSKIEENCLAIPAFAKAAPDEMAEAIL
ncbi:MAG: maleylacetoacetate isomerase [Alphaproteobacteria bacterium]|nr:MAG: maleylacetoacetate isomerase [Alphaproteobacteria bacterium]